MNKKVFYIALLLALVACEDKLELTHTYSRVFNKSYPICLNTSEIFVAPQVKPPAPFEKPFKIVSNGKYYFIGEMMKGIHVYDRQGNPVCFIECKYMKAFDVADNILYCNNFTDLIAIDVENPLQAIYYQRNRDYFNFWHNGSQDLPVSYDRNNRVYEIANKLVAMVDTVTDAHPDPDFSKFDKLYGNIILTEIPDTLQLDKPYTGIVNVEGDIFTLGGWNLQQCQWMLGDGWINYWGNSTITNYSSFMPIDKLLYKDGMVFLTGVYSYSSSVLLFFDYNTKLQSDIHDYRTIIDAVHLKQQTNWIVYLTKRDLNSTNLTGHSYGLNIRTPDYIVLENVVTSLINVNETILALSDHSMMLFVIAEYYDWGSSYWAPKEVKRYPFGGSSMLKEGDRLIVAGPEGLLFYNISDLENIVRIP